MLAERGTGTALGNRQRVSNMLDAGTATVFSISNRSPIAKLAKSPFDPAMRALEAVKVAVTVF